MADTAQKILIIEDERIFADLLTKRFTEEGFTVQCEYNGEAGLMKMRELAPTLVLLDIQLPIKDGYEVLREMVKDPLLKKIPVIVISNSGQPVEIEKIVEHGVKDYIVKAEFSLDEIFKKAKKYLDSVAQKANEMNAEKNASIKVLLVEDDSFLSSIVFGRLNKEGYNLRLAKDGEEALAEVAKEVPHVMLLDLIMPGIGGFEVLERVKADDKYKDISVVIFSNLGQEHEIERAKKLGADDFLIKAESTPGVVIEKIKQVLAKKAK
jgi:CheY-like chemotaxis protein